MSVFAEWVKSCSTGKKGRCILVMFKVDRILKILKMFMVESSSFYFYEKTKSQRSCSLYPSWSTTTSSLQVTLQYKESELLSLNILWSKSFYQLWSLVNWGFKVLISFVADQGIIALMSFIQSYLAAVVQQQAFLCFMRVLPHIPFCSIIIYCQAEQLKPVL